MLRAFARAALEQGFSSSYIMSYMTRMHGTRRVMLLTYLIAGSVVSWKFGCPGDGKKKSMDGNGPQIDNHLH